MSFSIELTDGIPSRISGSTADELYAALVAGRPSSMPLPGFMVGTMLDAARCGQWAPNALAQPPAIPAPSTQPASQASLPAPVANGKPASSDLLAAKPPGPEREYRRNKKPDVRPNHHARKRATKPDSKSEAIRQYLAKYKPAGEAARPCNIIKALKAKGVVVVPGHVSAVLAQLNRK
jgi:hypothetical protein